MPLLTVVTTLLTIATIFLVWIIYRRSQKNVHLLIKLNNEIRAKNHDLLQTLSALEQSQSHNNKMLKVVAHDLRGPLGAITSIAELSKDGHVPPEKYTEIMQIIYRSGSKALALANELLTDMERSDKLTNIEQLDIEDLLKFCTQLYHHRIVDKKQTIVLETTPVSVPADRGKLWRVFSNLISNAVKFSREGAQIKISMTVQNDLVVVAVHDNGIGIPDEIKDRIFEPTQASTRVGTFGEPSFGIGLSIARQIVLQHHGQLWFESSSDNGTTFYVSLPI